MKIKRAQHLKPGDTIHVEYTEVEVTDVHVFGPDNGPVAVLTDGNRHWFEFDDEVQVEGDWTREELDEVINRRFPNRLLTFYTEGANEVAAVEDGDGNMYRVWADDDTEFYKRG